MIIGLCGRSGSGKTTVSAILKSKGFAVIDADKIARLVVEKGSPALDELVAEFGEGILNADKTLNRSELFTRAMQDKHAHQRLSEITHKHIIAAIEEIIAQNTAPTVIDAPTLFESGFDKRCDVIVGVVSNDESNIERITKRDSIDDFDARLRLSRMLDDEFLRKNCNIIIENYGTLSELKQKSEELANLLKMV